MRLREALEELGAEPQRQGTWCAVVLTRRTKDGKIGKKVLGHSILDVLVEEDCNEINLITDERRENADSSSPALTVADLLARLKELPEECKEYAMYSGSQQVDLEDGYTAREDVPLIGVAYSADEKVFGFLQDPWLQWESHA